MSQTIPALPVRDLPAAVTCYVQRFGFEPVFVDDGIAVLRRDAAELHLEQATDRFWAERGSGAEETDSGTREFHTLDVDGNLLTFLVRLAD